MNREDQIKIANEYLDFYEKLKYKASIELAVAVRLDDSKMIEAAQKQIATYEVAIEVTENELRDLGA